ncbi:hypothetical protein [Rhabdochromatium marinum]|uniref:hypothetical protein n=1 Tax=Rhabdochromatium marinum TaxID=48729 RepID=UPI001F5B66C0|nr:hypothetical protein [Rhabdochromatium marinum]
MLSNLLFGGVFHELMPTYEHIRPLPVLFTESWPFALAFGGVALILAVVVFRASALALPFGGAALAGLCHLARIPGDPGTTVKLSWTQPSGVRHPCTLASPLQLHWWAKRHICPTTPCTCAHPG